MPPRSSPPAYNDYAGEKEITVWPYNGHEAGGVDDDRDILAFLRSRLGG